ncbi:MAG: iron-sulfur cluster assembly protein [Desulfobacterales bacterium]|nr:iron-sulfur cluster assembly protein [Desulfobacterales bacterium]
MIAGLVLGSFILGVKAFFVPNVDRAYHWMRANSIGPQEALAGSANSITDQDIVTLLSRVHDPELNINIVDLGLIYSKTIEESGVVRILMTLTVPTCPYGGVLIDEIKKSLFSHPWVQEIELRLTFDPAWSIEMISPATRAKLLGKGPSHIHVKEPS